MPALFTRMVTSPSSARVFSKHEATEPSSATSTRRGRAVPPPAEISRGHGVDLVLGAGGEGDGGALAGEEAGGRRADAASGRRSRAPRGPRVASPPRANIITGAQVRGEREIESPSNSGRSQRLSDIPLFPLNVVLMPGAPLPLHIFEDRYKQMVNECLEQESEFGMVFADESGTREVGCTAQHRRARRALRGRADADPGRGLAALQAQQRPHGQALLHGEIEFFEEEPRRT